MNPFIRKKFSTPVERDTVAEDWRTRGYSCDWFIDPPGREWTNFVHRCNELVTVVDGMLEMAVEGKTYCVEPGDEVFIPKGAVHSVKNIYTDTTRWLYGYD
jgi:mannose-6-phosphate isomerase-like protein (cupin superfamily)